MAKNKAVGRSVGGTPLSMIIDNVQNIAATEKAEHFESILAGALDAVERQVRERRKQQRNY
ncbi:MAG TPA: hypothetical protein VHP14_04920 [Anaerolineales bacterium]|nr:hypothetical protein [Anaerolineales bacterium]